MWPRRQQAGQRPLSLEVLSQQLKALLTGLSIPQAALVGFSLGGMINRRCAIDHHDSVSALMISNAPHERDPKAQRLVEERAAQTGEGGASATTEATLDRWFPSRFRETHTETVDKIRSWVLANDPDSYTKHRQVLATGVVALIRPNPARTAPYLIIACENESGSTPQMAQAIAGEINGSEILIVPDPQHLGLIEQTALFSTAIYDLLTRVLHTTGQQRTNKNDNNDRRASSYRGAKNRKLGPCVWTDWVRHHGNFRRPRDQFYRHP